jgi:hypothetical protein
MFPSFPRSFSVSEPLPPIESLTDSDISEHPVSRPTTPIQQLTIMRNVERRVDFLVGEPTEQDLEVASRHPRCSLVRVLFSALLLLHREGH